MITSKAIIHILSITFIVSGIPWGGYAIYSYMKRMRVEDPRYEIVALVQSTNSSEGLKTAFITELLQLSVDRQINLYRFDLKQARHLLLNFPLIKDAKVERIPPGIVSVEYHLRNPAIFLEDISNTAIDEEFYAIPIHPFFSPKKLPLFRIGISVEEAKWGQKIMHPRLKLAFAVHHALSELEIKAGRHPWRIDVSEADVESLGERKIIVIMQPDLASKPVHSLILDPQDYREGLKNYQKLMDRSEIGIASESGMIDLRLAGLGYFKKEP